MTAPPGVALARAAEPWPPTWAILAAYYTSNAIDAFAASDRESPDEVICGCPLSVEPGGGQELGRAGARARALRNLELIAAEDSAEDEEGEAGDEFFAEFARAMSMRPPAPPRGERSLDTPRELGSDGGDGPSLPRTCDTSADLDTGMARLMAKQLQGTSVARVLRAHSKMRGEIRLKPHSIVRKYLKGAAGSMGIPEGQAWSLRDHSKFLTWGRHRSLFRLHVLLGAILQLLLKGESPQAQALTVQGLKSVHQSALDQGSWQNAWLLTGLADPTRRQRIVDDEREMECGARYLKTLDEGEKRVTPSRRRKRCRAPVEDAVAEPSDAAGDPRGAGRGPRKRRA